MSSKKFGVDFDAATTPLDGTETLSIVQNDVMVDCTTQDIADLGFANPMTTAGDLIKGGVSGVPERLAIGTNGYILTVSAGAPVWAANSATVADGDKGDITVTASGATWTIDNGVVSNAKLADVATATFKGRTTAGTGVPEDLTATQATALLNTFTDVLKGLAPASGGGTTNFLRADGTWTAPSASVAWGGITGTLSSQTDLQTALDAKLPRAPSLQTVTAAATVTPTASNDMVVITAQDQALTLAAPTGSPSQGQKMVIRIKDNGTARAITWTSGSGGYRAIGVTLPTTTVISKTTYVGLIYNSTDTRWDAVAVTTEA